MEEPELKIYTVADLRDWLVHNQPKEGLSAAVIAPTRAYAIVHNPYVLDTDPVVAAIYEGGDLACYTSAFPERPLSPSPSPLIGKGDVESPRYWWFSGLWCNPAYRGRGFGLIVIGSLAEEYGVEYCLDRWGAQEVVEIFDFMGHKSLYTPRYVLGNKLSLNTWKGKLLHAVYRAERGLRKLMVARDKCNYALSYVRHIDNESYAFIAAHQGKDVFLHSQEMLNWELQYPVTVSCPLLEHVTNDCMFASSELQQSAMYAIQVKADDKMVGFYMLKHNDDSLHVLFAYYEQDAKQIVFASVRDHLERMGAMQCITDNLELAEYLKKQCGFRKIKTKQVSMSYPEGLTIPDGYTLQNGDGDNFMVV